MNAFFAMGGYAAFVWPSYVASLVVLIGAVIFTLRAHAKARAALARLEAEE